MVPAPALSDDTKGTRHGDVTCCREDNLEIGPHVAATAGIESVVEAPHSEHHTCGRGAMSESDASRQPTAAADTAQEQVTRVYDRIAAGYDLFESPMDWFGGARRRGRVLSAARGRVLEVGIGTGRNLTYYPDSVQLTGIDVSRQMLRRAQHRSHKLGHDVDLKIADVQRLGFADATFDAVTATCVFCSVADPVRGLAEVRRVVKPDGIVLLLEHVRPRNRLLGWLADQLTPWVRRLVGPEINRRTEENVVAAGLEITEVQRHGIWREIRARPGIAEPG